MKKSSLIAGLLGVYAFILMINFLLYALIDTYKLDVALATNLLIWSATIFAPIVLLMTYDSWRGQKSSEVIAIEAKEIVKNIDNYNKSCSSLIAYLSNIELFRDKYVNELVENKRLYDILYNSTLLFSNAVVDNDFKNCGEKISLNNAKIVVINLGLVDGNNETIDACLRTILTSCDDMLKIVVGYALYNKDIVLRHK